MKKYLIALVRVFRSRKPKSYILGPPTAAEDAATKSYVDGLFR